MANDLLRSESAGDARCAAGKGGRSHTAKDFLILEDGKHY